MADMEDMLDDLDDLTAQLIVNLHIKDIEELDDAQSRWRRLTRKQQDQQFARQLYKEDLVEYRSERGLPESLPEPEAEPEPEEQVERCACGDSNDIVRSYLAPCAHEYCRDCLANLFDASMKDERLFPPRCCNKPMPFEHARFHLDDKTEEQFAAKQEELNDRNRLYCHVPSCSAYIPPGLRLIKMAICPAPACGKYTCPKCNSGVHSGPCPEDQGLQDVLEAGRQEGWQQCQSCNRVIELTIGCNHITCVCRAEFCYVCGRRWKTCRCPGFTEHRLYERAREVARRQGRDEAEVAEQLRERHECEPGEHQYRYTPGAFRCDGCNVNHTQFIFRCRRCQIDMCCRCRRNY